MEIIKSEYDTNEYREIRLENGVIALLISKKHRAGIFSRVPRKGRKSLPKRTSNSNDCGEEISYSLSEEEEGEEGEEEEEGTSSEETSEEDSDLTESESEEEVGEEDSTFKAACAVCINAGSMCDPPDVPGLAHLLEHMVFMGSEKYSGENTFDSFLWKHGGHSNASTDYEKTVFYFTIMPRFFRKALDMFAHFFASPLLLESSLEREIEAVDSEFQSSMQTDSDRLQRLLCSVANPAHPFSTFIWGNAKSLKDMPKEKGICLIQCLRDFYSRHYSSHYMTVAVMSTDTLDELEQWTRSSFSAVPHNHLPPPDFKDCPPAFSCRDFHKLYRVVPVANENKVQLLWQLPCLFDKYRVKPMEYLAWLLGHEGEGSVLHYLKRKNLATEILVGNAQEGFEYNSCFSLFNCTITLTDKGHTHIDECLKCVFQYLQLLRESGPQKEIYHEIQTVEQNDFTFREEKDPVTYTENVCEAMQFYPIEHYLTGDSLFFEYDPKVITEVTEMLTPDKVNIIWSSVQFKEQCSLREEWFGTHYSSEDIPEAWKEAWEESGVPEYLHFPEPNHFIATDFTILPPPPEPHKFPVVVSEDSRHRLWFRQDTTFKLPRASLSVVLENPVHHLSARNAVLLEVFVKLLDLNMSNTVYNASVALLEYSCDIERGGIVVKINGLNDKLPLFFKEVVDFVVPFSTTRGDFDMIKEGLCKSYNNNDLDPDDLSKSTILRVLIPTYWSSAQKLTELEPLSIDDLTEFVSLFRERIYAEMLVQGNLSCEEAKSLAHYLCSELQFKSLPKECRYKPIVKSLPVERVVRVLVHNRDPDSPNTVITDYYQCCPRTLRDAAIASLLVSCMGEPAFNELRTKKQLGYEVYLGLHTYCGMIGFSLTVVSQSAKNSVETVGECMQNFISGFRATVKSWSKKEFQEHVQSAIQERLNPDVLLEEEVTRNWQEILCGRLCFDHFLREAVLLSELTQQDVCDWLVSYTHSGALFKELRVVIQTQCVVEEAVDGCVTGGVAVDGGLMNCVTLREGDIDAYKATLHTVHPEDRH